MRKKLTAFDVALVILLVLLSLIFIYPLWTIFVATFSDPMDYVKNPLALWPENFTLYNFNNLLTTQSIWQGYKNTIIYTVLGVMIEVTMTFVMAYALSLKELPYRRAIGFMITLTLFFSGGMIPHYLTIKNYRMLNTIWAMIIPGAIGTYNLMITRTYLTQQIPGDLVEAAEVDGAGALRTFIQIITPLCKPILAVLALFYAAGHWNGYTASLLYLRDRSMHSLQMVLRDMLINNQTMGLVTTDADGQEALYTITLNYAVMFVSILPMLLAFPFVQKFFVKGVMIGAIKG